MPPFCEKHQRFYVYRNWPWTWDGMHCVGCSRDAGKSSAEREPASPPPAVAEAPQ